MYTEIYTRRTLRRLRGEKMLRDRQAIMDYAFSCVEDASHGRDHILRVRLSALSIAESYPEADRDALECACILHDCGRPEQIADARVSHAQAGAKKAEAFLLGRGFEAGFAARVGAWIAAHSSPEMARMAGLEARILFDADKLEMTGAVGVLRAMMYSVEAGEPIYAPEGESFYRTAQNDLAFARANLFTAEAKAMAADRLQRMEDFLSALVREAGSAEAQSV